jgi:hypothetical protein
MRLMFLKFKTFFMSTIFLNLKYLQIRHFISKGRAGCHDVIKWSFGDSWRWDV